MITQLLIWIMAAYGMCNILVYGSIFNGPREFIREWGGNQYAPFNGFAAFLSNMLSCMMCCSVWVGFFFGIFLYSPVSHSLSVTPWVSWFFDGMLASGSVWAVNAIVEWYEENRPKQKEN